MAPRPQSNARDSLESLVTFKREEGMPLRMSKRYLPMRPARSIVLLGLIVARALVWVSSAQAQSDTRLSWLDRATITRSSQPDWVTPLITASANLEEAPIYDISRKLPPGSRPLLTAGWTRDLAPAEDAFAHSLSFLRLRIEAMLRWNRGLICICVLVVFAVASAQGEPSALALKPGDPYRRLPVRQSPVSRSTFSRQPKVMSPW